MHRFLSRVNIPLVRAAGMATALAMLIIAVVIPIEVIGRYVFGYMPPWSGELSVFALVWLTMMGGAAGFAKGYAIALTVVLDRLPPLVARIVRTAAQTVTLVFLGGMTLYGGLQTVLNWQQLSPAMGIPMSLPYAALPCGFGLTFLLTLEDLLKPCGPTTDDKALPRNL